jgi:hypothetical protein
MRVLKLKSKIFPERLDARGERKGEEADLAAGFLL